MGIIATTQREGRSAHGACDRSGSTDDRGAVDAGRGFCQVTSVVSSAFLLGVPVCAQSAFPKPTQESRHSSPSRTRRASLVNQSSSTSTLRTSIKWTSGRTSSARSVRRWFAGISHRHGVGRRGSDDSSRTVRRESGGWDSWYQPASGPGASRVGAFVLPARTRVHLLHGDLRLMIEQAARTARESWRKVHCWSNRRNVRPSGTIRTGPICAPLQRRWGLRPDGLGLRSIKHRQDSD